MRLLNTRTRQLKEFFNHFPPYAILSHTWNDDEVTFQDYNKYHELVAEGSPSSISISSRAGFKKIDGCCDLAFRDGFRWVWIDTCCIDKTSSAELSEAINSMFKWYAGSAVCYAYLVDVEDQIIDFSVEGSSFRRSRWFTRGWTLQELLAPKKIQFFSKEWELIGQMDELSETCDAVSSITSIPPAFLEGEPLESASVAQKMSWASSRQTTREEDIAYSLLGIFGVNIPLLYGEGTQAFGRLQEAIIRNTNDHTLFAWGALHWTDAHVEPTQGHSDFLAQSPAAFEGCYDLAVSPDHEASRWEMTNVGLQVKLKLRSTRSRVYDIGMLNCFSRRDPSRRVAIFLKHVNNDIYYRSSRHLLLINIERRPHLKSIWTNHTIFITRFEENLQTRHSVSLEIPEGYWCQAKYIHPSIRVKHIRSIPNSRSFHVDFVYQANYTPELANRSFWEILRYDLVRSISFFRKQHHIWARVPHNTIRLCLQLDWYGRPPDPPINTSTSLILLLLLKPGLPPYFAQCVLSPLALDEECSDQLETYYHLQWLESLHIGKKFLRVCTYGRCIGSKNSGKHFRVETDEYEQSWGREESYDVARRSATTTLYRAVLSYWEIVHIYGSVFMWMIFSICTCSQRGGWWASQAAWAPVFMPLWFQIRGDGNIWRGLWIMIFYGGLSLLTFVKPDLYP